MGKKERPIDKLPTSRAAAGVILSVVILAVAQALGVAISEMLFGLGVPLFICNMIAGILYVAFTFAGAALLCKKILKVSLSEMRISRIQLKAVWLTAAILMPVLTVLSFLLTGGHWETDTFDTQTVLATVAGAVVFYGFAAGIVEEIIFRGLIMGCLEKRFHIKIAVIVPSVLFGALHIIGNRLDFISIIQLLIAGSVVGILFSLITFQSKSVWNSAVVHGIWNMVIVGGILHIGSSADSSSLYNYVIEHKSFLLTGGDFGIEASVISIAVYLIFIALAMILLKKDSQKNP